MSKNKKKSWIRPAVQIFFFIIVLLVVAANSGINIPFIQGASLHSICPFAE